MNVLYIKQKVFSISGKFTVKDENENDIYFAEGSFLKVPKTFTIMDTEKNNVAQIVKKAFSFLPTFFLEVSGQEVVTIKKQFSFLKARYTIDAAGIEVRGNWWDMNFEVLQDGEVVGKVDKKWFSWGDSYRVQVTRDDMETLLVALVIAIDCVKASQSAAAASST